MPSDLKSETARINGAKSHGPKTPEGKARSAANSRRHGLAGASIILPGESEEDFQLLLADYIAQFQPQTGVESDLVEVMAVSRWRLRRLLAIETPEFELGVFRRSKDLDKEVAGTTYNDRLADVFKHLSYGNTLTLLLRYESSINRSYDQALKQLQQLQSKPPVGSFRIPPPAPAPQPNPDREGGDPRLPKATVSPDCQPTPAVRDDKELDASRTFHSSIRRPSPDHGVARPDLGRGHSAGGDFLRQAAS